MKSKYIDLFQEADKLLTQKITEDKPVVAAWGLMNAGKSYLLNMLTNQLETEFFRTADRRETAELKRFETDRFTFLDTPGLDANAADDKVANQGAAKADVVLFVHQPQGELEKNELDFLQDLKTSFGKYAEQNIIIVLSKSDKENSDKIRLIEQKIGEQCQSLLGFVPRIFQTSGTRYKTGVTENKDGLKKASHIPDLEQHLNTIDFTQISAVKRERQVQALDAILAKLAKAEKQVSKTKAETQQLLVNGFSSFNNTMSSLNNTIASHVSQFNSI
ncbi:GTPase [Aeromonas allosaccharophila]